MLLETLRLMLGLNEDEDVNAMRKLEWIIESTKERLKTLLGGIDPGSDLDYIVIEISIIRYNRIGSEGLSSHDVAGEKQAWSENDFAGYMQDIQAYMDRKNGTGKGRMRFL